MSVDFIKDISFFVCDNNHSLKLSTSEFYDQLSRSVVNEYLAGELKTKFDNWFEKEKIFFEEKMKKKQTEILDKNLILITKLYHNKKKNK